jgi:signal transduction histidine kinase
MTPRLLFVILLCICNQSFSQSAKGLDSASANTGSQKNSLLQQTKLLSRQQQAELIEQARQKQLYEQQKLALSQQEKQLMELKFQKNNSELELEKKNAEQVSKQIQLQSRMREYVKDEEIKAQEKELSSKREWNFYLTILFVLVMGFAAVAYSIQLKTKRLNEVIKAQHAELEEMGIVKDTILGVVSHDMRLPVNSLISFSELLKAGAISEEKMSLYLDQIANTLNHSSATMNNLLNWTATQMQGFNPSFIPVDMAMIAEDVMENLLDRAMVKKIGIQNDIEIGCIVLADKNMSELIIRNLLSNAIKYSAAYDSILISATEQEGRIVVSVQDEGVGMSEENIRLFNSPSKKPLISTTGTASEKGTGLGLLLCKTFANLMHGNIAVSKNSNGKGMVFELSLSKANSESVKRIS